MFQRNRRGVQSPGVLLNILSCWLQCEMASFLHSFSSTPSPHQGRSSITKPSPLCHLTSLTRRQSSSSCKCKHVECSLSYLHNERGFLRIIRRLPISVTKCRSLYYNISGDSPIFLIKSTDSFSLPARPVFLVVSYAGIAFAIAGVCPRTASAIFPQAFSAS